MCVPRPGRPSVGRPMSNDEVYAAGFLNRALDPATQPPEIRSYLRAEIELLDRTVVKGMTVIDFGCGTGRHLAMFGDRLRLRPRNVHDEHLGHHERQGGCPE